MPQRPSSPTQLLWAHKLSLEHKHIDTKIKSIEAGDQQRESRMAHVESSNKKTEETVATCKDLAVRVKLLEEDDSEQKMRFETLDKDRGDRIEKHGARLDAQELRLRKMHELYRELDETKDKMLEDSGRQETLIKDLQDTIREVAISKVFDDQIKAVNDRIDKIIEDGVQERKAAKQQIAAAYAKLQRESERRKVIEAENQRLAIEAQKLAAESEKRKVLEAENQKLAAEAQQLAAETQTLTMEKEELQREVDQKANDLVNHRLNQAAKLPPPTPRLIASSTVTNQSSPLAKPQRSLQRYRSGFNLRGRDTKHAQLPAASKRVAHLAPPSSNLASGPLLMSDDDSLYRERTPPEESRKRKLPPFADLPAPKKSQPAKAATKTKTRAKKAAAPKAVSTPKTTGPVEAVVNQEDYAPSSVTFGGRNGPPKTIPDTTDTYIRNIDDRRWPVPKPKPTKRNVEPSTKALAAVLEDVPAPEGNGTTSTTPLGVPVSSNLNAVEAENATTRQHPRKKKQIIFSPIQDADELNRIFYGPS
ncbi:hypothetical protein EJ08DRAFT_144978 [Tothia fuscella]|uniref:Uncharacterized protein n=1 Tax=Tothia fuscella TaxID=1048955 RepID=A0A9P4U4T8_9PEZI|nr:hypothetical protein EJ08DRAFT_144978 [Tothia fuscella]